MSKAQRVADKIVMASELATVGSALGPVGTIGGALTGLLIGDKETVFPLDMIAIPAYQAYLITGAPAMQVYIRAGETLVPTGGNVEDVQSVMPENTSPLTEKPKRKKTTAYQRKYRAAFKKVKSKHKKKDGQWKKGGFKAAVKAAHKIAGGK